MFLEYFTPVYLCKVCSVLTYNLKKKIVDCTLNGVLYTVHRAVVYNRDVSKGRYLPSSEKGKSNPNLTGAFERRVLCLYTERDLIVRKVPTEWDTSPFRLPTLRRKQVLFQT
jgi:hypothetical protein